MSAIALPTHEHALGGMLAAYQDATERLRLSHERLQAEVRRLHEELARKNEELRRRERLAALGHMAAGLAHEVRNPLGGIALQASLLEKEVSGQPQARSKAATIREGVRAIDRLVGDVLSFAREGRIACDAVDVSVVMASLERRWLPNATRGGVTIRFLAKGQIRTVVGDEAKIERAIGNLVNNAIDAAGPGGEVQVSVESAGEFVEWRVADTGPGIPRATLPRIFDPFFTTKADGTGLGLSIVHEIVEAHGGRVRAENRSAGGAMFVVSLPLGNMRQGVSDGHHLRIG